MTRIGKLSSAALIALVGLTATADARPDVRQMTCAEAQGLVRQRGEIVLTTGQYTFSRFVSNVRYCYRNQVLYRQFVSTRDTGSCLVGFGCREPLFDDYRFRERGWR